MDPSYFDYEGPPIDDPDLLRSLPQELATLLSQRNGWIMFGGGLHVRGVCKEPAWHSLREAWHGETAFHKHYPAVQQADVPFAEDCLGDQFLLSDAQVLRLSAETGAVENLYLTLAAFLEAAQVDPVGSFSLQPLQRFWVEGGSLAPGQLLSAYPPFCTSESKNGVSLASVSSLERRMFLAEFSRQLSGVPDGASIRVVVK